MTYRIDISLFDPWGPHSSHPECALAYDYKQSPEDAVELVRVAHNAGLWAEISEGESRKPVAGPFNPGEPLPLNVL